VPEGHTLHRLARAHQRHYARAPVAVSSPQGRFAAAAALVDGRVLERAEALGKHLFHVYGPDLVVHVHLGLYGKFSEQPLPVQPAQGQVRMRLVGATHWSDLRGPAACELITDVEVDGLRARLGPDPLRRDADPERAWARVCRSRAPIATLLMDQSVLAGVGNVYRAEVLFRQRLDPTCSGRDLGTDGWDAVWADLVALMRDGMRRGRIVTLRPEHRRRRAPGSREHYVYRRAGLPCLVCGTPVATAVLGGRNLYWCPYCQRPPGT
jgi:endonuclease-8